MSYFIDLFFVAAQADFYNSFFSLVCLITYNSPFLLMIKDQKAEDKNVQHYRSLVEL